MTEDKKGAGEPCSPGYPDYRLMDILELMGEPNPRVTLEIF